MATAVLCGLEKQPELNGCAVRLLEFHDDRGRWEVEVAGTRPKRDLFKIEWHESWYTPMDDYKDPFEEEKKKAPTFKETLQAVMQKKRLTESWKSLTILDCNGKKVRIFDEVGQLHPELAGPHIPYKSDAVNVVRSSFPLQFQSAPDSSKTLAIKPSSLRVKEDDSVEKGRLRKVEMSVNAVHEKPALDGQFGQLGAFNATMWRWTVRPDIARLWDVKVDGSLKPVLLRSSEVFDDGSGESLIDPIRVVPWDRKSGQRAICAAVGFKRGSVIFEDEPLLSMKGANSLAPSEMKSLWEQFLRIPIGGQEDILSMCKGVGNLKRLAGDGPVRSPQEVLEMPEFKSLSPADCERACSLFQIFSMNFMTHEYCAGRYLYPVVARVNHSCAPNASVVSVPWHSDCHEFNRKAVVALHDIEPGEEITVQYSAFDDVLLPTQDRQDRLASQGFQCCCPRCQDPNSDASLAKVLCARDGSASTAKEDEKLHRDILLELLKGPVPSTADMIIQLVEGAQHCGLAPDHWIVCRARDLLSLVYLRREQPALAVANIEPILALQAAHGIQDWQRMELYADMLSRTRRLHEAFQQYGQALTVCKQLCADLTAESSASCSRLRLKLRRVLDGCPVAS
mmetsp:Transcript_33342/g.76035  ORF Transcript_33342/g.76035 Transcript_33342/m.76035 type:complete len:623 (+) Transcript_33342:68-1936(+)